MKVLLVIFILVLATGSFLYFKNGGDKTENGMEIKIYGNKLEMRVADTPGERQQGLQNVAELPEDSGMIFIFERAAEVTFWNKNTLLDLDIIWVNNSRVVGISFLPKQSGREIVRVKSPAEVDVVIEVNAGWTEMNNIKKGALVSGL
jgi:uncharacterized protein